MFGSAASVAQSSSFFLGLWMPCRHCKLSAGSLDSLAAPCEEEALEFGGDAGGTGVNPENSTKPSGQPESPRMDSDVASHPESAPARVPGPSGLGSVRLLCAHCGDHYGPERMRIKSKKEQTWTCTGCMAKLSVMQRHFGS